jgi:hypothetical protein
MAVQAREVLSAEVVALRKKSLLFTEAPIAHTNHALFPDIQFIERQFVKNKKRIENSEKRLSFIRKNTNNDDKKSLEQIKTLLKNKIVCRSSGKIQTISSVIAYPYARQIHYTIGSPNKNDYKEESL